MDVRILDDELRDTGSELTLSINLRSAIPFQAIVKVRYQYYASRLRQVFWLHQNLEKEEYVREGLTVHNLLIEVQLI